MGLTKWSEPVRPGAYQVALTFRLEGFPESPRPTLRPCRKSSRATCADPEPFASESDTARRQAWAKRGRGCAHGGNTGTGTGTKDAGAGAVGMQVFDCGAGADGPPPSSMRSSAHSQEILYLWSRWKNAAANCLWGPAGSREGFGLVFDRARERGRGLLKNVGEVGRGQRTGSMSATLEENGARD